MTRITAPQHGDQPDAAIFAFINGTPPTSGIVSGLGLSLDATIPEVTVSAGKAVVDRGTMTTAHPKISPQEDAEDAVAVVQIDSQTVGLDDASINHIYLDANIGNDDSGTVVANTTNADPSTASFKIGEIDTSADTVREKWNLFAADGTLTYPDESSASELAGDLKDGTIVFDRDAGSHKSVVAGVLKNISPLSDSDNDGVYNLPNQSDGISVGTLEAGSSLSGPTASEGDVVTLDSNPDTVPIFFDAQTGEPLVPDLEDPV